MLFVGPSEAALREARLAALSGGQPFQQGRTISFGERNTQANRNTSLNTRETNKPNEKGQTMNKESSELRRRPLRDKSDDHEPTKKKQEKGYIDGNCDSMPSGSNLTVSDQNYRDVATADNVTNISSQPNKISELGDCGDCEPKVETMSASTSKNSSPPSSTSKLVKKTSPVKIEAQTKAEHPNLAGEELYLYVLSKIFNLKMVINIYVSASSKCS